MHSNAVSYGGFEGGNLGQAIESLVREMITRGPSRLVHVKDLHAIISSSTWEEFEKTVNILIDEGVLMSAGKDVVTMDL